MYNSLFIDLIWMESCRLIETGRYISLAGPYNLAKSVIISFDNLLAEKLLFLSMNGF